MADPSSIEELERRLAEAEAALRGRDEVEARLQATLAELHNREAVLARVQRIGRIAGLDINIVGGLRSGRSPEYMQLHGVPFENSEETHDDWLARVHPDDRERAEQALFSALQSDAKSYASQYRIIRPSDGAIRWIEVRADIERDDHGRAVRLVGAHVDVTEHKLTQEALRESEERFRTLADTLPALIWINDERGGSTFINQYYIDYTGRTAEQIKGEGWHGLLHPDHEEPYVAGYLKAVAAREAWQDRALIRPADGAWRWIDNYARPLFGKDGRYRGHVGVSIDVDDAVRADALLRESEKRQAFLLKLSDALRPLVRPADIQACAARVLGQHLDVADSIYWEADPDNEHVISVGRYAKGTTSIPDRVRAGSFGTHVRETLTTGRTLAIADVAEDPHLTEAELAAYEAIGVRAYIAVPLVKEDRFVAVLGVYCCHTHAWTTEEISLAKETAERTWAAVERARAEAALRESEQRLRAIYDGTHEYIGLVSPNGTLLEANRASLEFAGQHFGNEREDVVGCPFWETVWFVHTPGAPEQLREAVARAANGEFVRYEAPLARPSGEIIIFDFSLHPVRDESGKVILIVPEGRDITTKKQAEHRLHESEERFAQFAASSTDVLWIRRAETLGMEYLSPAFATVYGMNPEEAMGDVRRWAKLVVPEDRDVALEHLGRARRGEAVIHEFRIRRPSDGSFRWIRNHDFPLYDGGGTKWIGGIATDVTEARLAVEHQAVLLAELQHRVRNIMAMLRAVVARTGDTAETAADYRALMIGRLMALARTQALLTSAANVGVKVGVLIREELKAQAHHEAQYRLVGPEVVISPKAAEILSLAIHELATNALKYGALSMREGKVEVAWRILQPDGQPLLHLGWTEHRLAPSDWVPPTRKGFGTQLIEQRVPYELRGRGKIEIRPEGAHAWIEFPLQPGASILETDAPIRTSVFGGSIDMTGEPSLTGKTVLLLEDDFYLAQDAVAALRGAGADVVGPYPTTAEAIAALEGHALAAAVVDINLGFGPSFEAAWALRKAGAPFVFLTGYDRDAIPAEFADVVRLQKPVEPRDIVCAVAALAQG